MAVRFNPRQAQELSDFFFDVAEGSVLGFLDFSVGATGMSPLARLVNALGGLVLSYFLVRLALPLLEEVS